MKTINDLVEFLKSVGVGVDTNPEFGPDPIAFVIRHYNYMAHTLAAAAGIQEGGYYCIRDANGNVIWEGQVSHKVVDEK